MQNALPAFCILHVQSALETGLAGQVHAKALEGALVHLRQDHGGVDIAASQLTQLVHGELGNGVCGSGDGQGNEGLVGVETGIPVAQMVGLQILDGLQNDGGDHVQIIRQSAQLLLLVATTCYCQVRC